MRGEFVEACPSTSSGHIETSSGHIETSSGHIETSSGTLRQAQDTSGHPVAGDRTRHAARPAAPRTQLGPSDGNYLDPGLDEAPIRLDIALIGNRDLGLDGERVVPVVPLLALG